MTNKQFLVDHIKKMLERDDLADTQRVRLLSLFAKHVPAPRRRKRKAAKVVAHKPFQNPA
jgi:hypothetical protein